MPSLSSIMLLVLVASVVKYVHSGPAPLLEDPNFEEPVTVINPRASMTNEELVSCFTALAEGRPCDTTPDYLGHNVGRHPCQCVPSWQCRDRDSPSPSTNGISLAHLIDIRSTCIDPTDTCCRNTQQTAISFPSIPSFPSPLYSGPPIPSSSLVPLVPPFPPPPISVHPLPSSPSSNLSFNPSLPPIPTSVHPFPSSPSFNPSLLPFPSSVSFPSSPDDSHVSRCGQTNQFQDQMSPAYDGQAQFGQFPWMAVVLEKSAFSNTNLYISGGSLIHPGVVLTAAHLVDDKEPQNLVVRLGHLKSELEDGPVILQDIEVERISCHPKFQRKHLIYDLAMLFLKERASIRPSVNTICLPTTSEVFDNASCFMSGYGKDDQGSDGFSERALKSVPQLAINHQLCQYALRDTQLGSTFILDESFMCARSTHGINTCNGDGGSPLVCPLISDPTRYVQAGVMAWGTSCGSDNSPSVYASVTNGVPWINEEVTAHFGILELAFK